MRRTSLSVQSETKESSTTTASSHCEEDDACLTQVADGREFEARLRKRVLSQVCETDTLTIAEEMDTETDTPSSDQSITDTACAFTVADFGIATTVPPLEASFLSFCVAPFNSAEISGKLTEIANAHLDKNCSAKSPVKLECAKRRERRCDGGNWIRRLKWSPDGSQLMAVSNDRRVRVFKSRVDDDCTLQLEFHSAVYDVCWHSRMNDATNRDLSAFLVAPKNRCVQLWNSWQHSDTDSLTLTADETSSVGGSDTAVVSETTKPKLVTKRKTKKSKASKPRAEYSCLNAADELLDCCCLCFDKCGQHFYGGFANGKQQVAEWLLCRPWDAPRMLSTVNNSGKGLRSRVTALSFAPYSLSPSILACASFESPICVLLDRRCRYPVAAINDRSAVCGIQQLEFVPNSGRFLVTASRKLGAVNCWDLRKPLTALLKSDAAQSGLKWQGAAVDDAIADGRMFAAKPYLNDGNTIVLKNANTADLRHTFERPLENHQFVSFDISADGHWLTAGAHDGVCHFWHLSSALGLEAVSHFGIDHRWLQSQSVSQACFNPLDTSVVATATGQKGKDSKGIHIWHTKLNECKCVVEFGKKRASA